MIKKRDKDRFKANRKRNDYQNLMKSYKKTIEEYKVGRDKGEISSPILLWLKNNTLTTGTRDFRLDPQRMGSEGSKAQLSNQLKSQVIMKKKNKSVIQFVKDNAVLKIE